jgi:hypothetical protein
VDGGYGAYSMKVPRHRSLDSFCPDLDHEFRSFTDRVVYKDKATHIILLKVLQCAIIHITLPLQGTKASCYRENYRFKT